MHVQDIRNRRFPACALRVSGELQLVKRDMQETSEVDSEEFVNFKDKSNRFLGKAAQLLMSLIAESGRDRFCYVKEALIHPDATCARPAPLTTLILGQSKESTV